MSTNIDITNRLMNINWVNTINQLNTFGYSHLNKILTENECDSLVALYSKKELFRTHIHLEKHNFGKGEYKYFNYPLPNLISELRDILYSKLVAIANDWNQKLNINIKYPNTLKNYLDICHSVGQYRPTPLLLKYKQGDYNCLHQDLYGDLKFPFQIVFLLSEYEKDFCGGEFIMTEQRPHKQTRPIVINLQKGEAVIFTVQHRPVQGSKRIYRVNMKHGVSTIHHGRRHSLGIIFHDAL